MSNLQRYIAKAKKHPIFTSLAFLGALVIGLGSFTDALSSLSERVQCLPIKLGVGEPYEGQIIAKLKKSTKEWVKLRTIKTERRTGNHHCERNCRGEPTRSNYTMELSVLDYVTSDNSLLKLRGPKLKCISGPCGGWNHVYYTKLSENSKLIHASFDVWSHPTVWELSAELLSYDVIKEETFQKIIDVSSNEVFTITVPRDHTPELLKGLMQDGHQFVWKIGESDPSGTVVLESKILSDSGSEYIYRVNDHRCK